ncbi:MAG: class I SAM-dependent methyltransferase, partial [Candidatus Methanoperedens sp.]
VVACDLSIAVNACYENLRELYHSAEFNVVQASIYELPFKLESFDYVFCIGVIQHTPDPSKSIKCISSMVKKEGKIGLWIYERNWKSYIGTLGFKYLLRPFTKRMGMRKNDAFALALTVLFSPLILSMRHLGVIGKVVLRLMPVASSYLVSLPLNNRQLLEWVYLDTLDMYSPAHDHPMKFNEVKNILETLNFKIKRTPPPGISISAFKGG